MNYKTFAKVEEGDLIFTMNPIEGTIIGLMIKTVSVPSIKSKLNPLDWVILRYYLIKPQPGLELKTLIAEAIKIGKEPMVRTLIVPRKNSSVIVNTIPPLIYATTEDELQSWSSLKKNFSI